MSNINNRNSGLIKFTRDCLTGIDGRTYDIGRVLWALAFIVGMGLEIGSAVAGHAFDLTQYGLGVGALLVAGGGALRIKAGTEPK